MQPVERLGINRYALLIQMFASYLIMQSCRTHLATIKGCFNLELRYMEKTVINSEESERAKNQAADERTKEGEEARGEGGRKRARRKEKK